ncbi:zinc finger protein 700-like isoform X2 [Topomyia yanbarensis]|uniref:zinc finger protein 700-like isoform X2 n=1 Tax=Topomyia yanbarensis TaxID=2498891 RepID=UPI00273C8A44|nr:zinc finger protein 700-like isoform X2 [Topomyia yanbarensis]
MPNDSRIVADSPVQPLFDVVPFECAEIKTEPLDDEDPDSGAVFGRTCNKPASSSSVAVQTAKRRVMSRSIQVDLQLVTQESLASAQLGFPGVDEALSLDPTTGSLEKQCRICLRQLPETSLSYIVFAQKTKILNALGVKIYLGDAYPFICRNCSALVDMMYDFRNTCIKARNMLVHERKSIQSDGWDSVENLEVIGRCKAFIESHKQTIDRAYETSSLHKISVVEEEVKVKPEAIELVMVDQITTKQPALNTNNLSLKEEADSSNHSQNVDTKIESSSCSSAQGDSSDESDDRLDDDFVIDSEVEDYAPSPEPQSKSSKKKRIRIVTKPYRKRQKAIRPKTDDHLALQDADGKVRKRRKNAADPNRKRGSLCDFCGEWVEYHTVESHKNQHLGIKPYTCQSEGCRLSFYCRNLLIKHIKRQHRAEGPEYNDCEICGQRIKGPKAALKKHQKTHTEEKNYICAVCGKGFTTQGYLRQHSIIHTDLMPFECSVCHRKFNNKYNMLTHEKKHQLRGELFPPDAASAAGATQAVELSTPSLPSSLPEEYPVYQQNYSAQHQALLMHPH